MNPNREYVKENNIIVESKAKSDDLIVDMDSEELA